MVAKATAVDVSCVDGLVLLRIGNLSVSMEFDVAMRLSARLLREGRLARRFAADEEGGEVSMMTRSSGILVDANAGPSVSRFIPKAPERMNDVGAVQVGRQVRLRLGRTAADMPAFAALRISQWLRLRAKQARNEMGEKAHWVQIANDRGVIL